jgi:hypothetical protein
MTTEREGLTRCVLRAAIAGSLGVVLNGCLQTVPVAVQDQDERMVYNCAGGRRFNVTRLRDQGAVIVAVDGSTLRLNRDAAYAAAERYTNRQQTLTFSKDGATYEWPGRATYSRCTTGDGYSSDENKRVKQLNTD